MSHQPLTHLRMFVCSVIVDDGVDHLSHGNLLLDGVEKADEFLVAMTWEC
jgi:hypothetical protein